QGKGELPMRATLKRELYTLCDTLLLLAVPGLVPPRHAYGQSLRPSSVEGAPAGHTGRGAEPGARPCAQLLDLLGIVEGQDHESLLNSFRVPDFSGVFGFRCFTSLGPIHFAGRVRAFIVRPDDPNTIWAAAASGGLWVTHDAGGTWSRGGDITRTLAFSS